MTEVKNITLFAGQGAEGNCNTFLNTQESIKIVSIQAIYDVANSQMNYLVTFLTEV